MNKQQTRLQKWRKMVLNIQWTADDDDRLLKIYNALPPLKKTDLGKIRGLLGRTKSVPQIRVRLKRLNYGNDESNKPFVLTDEIRKACLTMKPKEVHAMFPYRRPAYWAMVAFRLRKNLVPRVRAPFTKEETDYARRFPNSRACFAKFKTHTLHSWDQFIYYRMYKNTQTTNKREPYSQEEKEDAMIMSAQELFKKYPHRSLNAWKCYKHRLS